MKNFKLTIFSIVCVVIALNIQCNKSSAVYIEVQGKKYTVKDLKSQNPNLYSKIQKDYNEQIVEALDQLATEKLFELAAKKEKISGGAAAYENFLRTKSQKVSDAEVKRTYAQFKAQGQIGPEETFENIETRLRAYLQEQKDQSSILSVVSQLKQEYKYKKYEGPIQRQSINIKNEPVRSNPKAKLLIVEFSGFDCGYCKRVQATTKKIRETYGDKIKWVYKDYPLNTNSIGAHAATHCVFKQDEKKFWDLFDLIYQNDKAFRSEANLNKFIPSLKIDQTKYDTCMKDPETAKEILDDHKEGIAAGVSGIPSFFINGRNIVGARGFQNFKEVIDQELNK